MDISHILTWVIISKQISRRDLKPMSFFVVNKFQHNAWYTQSCLQKCLSFQYKPGKRLLVQSQQLEHVWSMLTANNAIFFILNPEQFSHLILGRMISRRKPFKTKSLLPFNFSITNICVAIRLAADGTRMGSKDSDYLLV